MSLLHIRQWCWHCCVQSSSYKHPNTQRYLSFSVKDHGPTHLQNHPMLNCKGTWPSLVGGGNGSNVEEDVVIYFVPGELIQLIFCIRCKLGWQSPSFNDGTQGHNPTTKAYCPACWLGGHQDSTTGRRPKAFRQTVAIWFGSAGVFVVYYLPCVQ